MEPRDVADQLNELAALRCEPAAERAEEAGEQCFRRRAAPGIAVLAVLLAIKDLGGDNAGKETVNNTSLASDAWAFYQAKTLRQTSFRLAADELELLLPARAPEQPAARAKIDSYTATAARYESEPDPADPQHPLKGEGKQELLARARDVEARREHAQRQAPNFDDAGARFQIAIVLGPVAIPAASRPVLGLAVALGAVATVLLPDGFFLRFDLPLA